jgi:hypothetical protein
MSLGSQVVDVTFDFYACFSNNCGEIDEFLFIFHL